MNDKKSLFQGRTMGSKRDGSKKEVKRGKREVKEVKRGKRDRQIILV